MSIKLTIRTKIILGFSVIILAAANIGYFVLTNIAKEALKENIGENAVILAIQTIDKIDRTIESRIEQVEAYAIDLSEEPYLIKNNEEFDLLDEREEYIFQKDEEWRAVPDSETTEFINELVNNELSQEIRKEFQLNEFYEEKYGYPVFSEVFLTNKYGANVAQTGRTSDYYQADEEWWQNAKKESLYIEDVSYDESADVYSINICVRMDDSKGDFLGVIKVVLDIKEVISIIKALEPEETKHEEGHISHGPKEYKTTHFNLISKDGRSIYSTKEFEFMQDISYTVEPRYGHSDDPEHELYTTGIGASGKEELFAHFQSKGYKDYEGLGWFLTVEYQTEEIFAPVKDLSNNFFLIIAGAASFLLFFAIVNTYFITKPIKKLIGISSVVAGGDLTQRAEVSSKDEMGQLAESFNEMLDELQTARQGVEKKIAERTSQLERLNEHMVGRELRIKELKEELQKLKKQKE